MFMGARYTKRRISRNAARPHNRRMRIEVDDLTREPVIALLQEHLANMYEWSPPESVHALDLARLRVPEITFWSAWEAGELVGCGALKALSASEGEIKSMRTPQDAERNIFRKCIRR